MKELALQLPGNFTITSSNVPMGGINPVANNLLTAIVNLFFIIVMALAVIFLVLGGIRWITSGGDPKGIEAARKQITFALIGAVIATIAFFIVNFVGNFLGTTTNLIP